MRTLSQFLIFLSFCALCSAGECGRTIYNLLLLTPRRRAVFPESGGAKFLPCRFSGARRLGRLSSVCACPAPKLPGPSAATLSENDSFGEKAGSEFPRQIQALMQQALQQRDRRQQEQISDQGVAVARGRLEARLDRSLQGRYRSLRNRRLANHLLHSARPPATPVGIPSDPESPLFLSAQTTALSRSYALNNYNPPLRSRCSKSHSTHSGR